MMQKAARAVTGTPQVVRGNWNNNRVDLLSVQYNQTF